MFFLYSFTLQIYDIVVNKATLFTLRRDKTPFFNTQKDPKREERYYYL